MLSILFCFLLLVTGNLDYGLNRGAEGSQFWKIVKKATERLQVVGNRRPLRLGHLNESLEKTAVAARGMLVGGDENEIWRLLEEARSDYDKNSFAILLEAMILSARGNREGANQLYELFLLKSRTFSEFEETFLKWREFHMLRRHVYDYLLSQGVSFEGREEEIQVRIPYEELMKYVMNPKDQDQLWSVVFVLLILGGGVGLIIANLMGVDFESPVIRVLPIWYLVVWLSYALWMFDLAFGLPFGWNRSWAIPILSGITIGGSLAMEGYAYWVERKRPLEQGYQRCPNCQSVILHLLVECPYCRRKLKA